MKRRLCRPYFCMSFAPLRVGGSGRGLSDGWRFCLPAVLFLLVVFTTSAHGQTTAPGEAERALPAVIGVGVPAPANVPVVVSGGLGYGWLDASDGLDGGHRVASSVAAAYAPVPQFALGLDMRGHWDRYADTDSGSPTKLYGEPRLTLRFSEAVSQRLLLGAEADARFVGAQAPSVELSATSPSIRGLVGFELSQATWAAAHLGFHVDRSAQAIPNPARLTVADKRTIGASAFNALQWGFGVSHRLATRTEILGEIAGELMVGADRPGVGRSPYRLSAGARHPLSRAFSVMGVIDVSLSKRPLSLQGDALVPVEPRAALGAALIWHFDPNPPEPAHLPTPETAPEPEPPLVTPPEPEPEPPPVPTSVLEGVVVDEGGRPLPDAEVTLSHGEHEQQTTRTAAAGEYEFADVPDEAPVSVRVSTPGFESATVTLSPGHARQREIVLRPAVPAGQVRGKVLDLQGNAIGASVTITPGDHQVVVQPDGSFELELAPGNYTVKFQRESFSTQWRKIRVHDRGVVILNIALTR